LLLLALLLLRLLALLWLLALLPLLALGLLALGLLLASRVEGNDLEKGWKCHEQQRVYSSSGF
jgi:hypothetical protein